jgi:hypothetical protein
MKRKRKRKRRQENRERGWKKIEVDKGKEKA